MNLKERIELMNQLKSVSVSDKLEIKQSFRLSDVFVRNDIAEQIFVNEISKNTNVILLCPNELDKTLASSYIREFLSHTTSVEVLNNITEDLPFATAEKIVIPEPSMTDIIKVFEYIIKDYGNFIFCLNLKSFDNVLESLKTLVALNAPNLPMKNVEHLIGMSEPLLVYIKKNDNCLFDITNIAKIVYSQNDLSLHSLYPTNPVETFSVEDVYGDVIYNDEVVDVQNIDVEETEIIKEDNSLSFVEPIEVETNDEYYQNDIQVKSVIIEDSFQADEEDIVEEEQISLNKINKYKLLKEKFKNKKHIDELE